MSASRPALIRWMELDCSYGTTDYTGVNFTPCGQCTGCEVAAMLRADAPRPVTGDERERLALVMDGLAGEHEAYAARTIWGWHDKAKARAADYRAIAAALREGPEGD